MLKVNISGTWKTVKYCYVNVSGTWKTVGQIYTKVSGAWKPIWSYSWNTGAWGNCSKTCGTGTQTRTVQCKRNDGQIVLDSLCTKYVGAKPATSQNCNTQTCEECKSGYTLVDKRQRLYIFRQKGEGNGYEYDYFWNYNSNDNQGFRVLETTSHPLIKDGYKYYRSGNYLNSWWTDGECTHWNTTWMEMTTCDRWDNGYPTFEFTICRTPA